MTKSRLKSHRGPLSDWNICRNDETDSPPNLDMLLLAGAERAPKSPKMDGNAFKVTSRDMWREGCVPICLLWDVI